MTYVNPMGTCQTLYTGTNWQIQIYGVTDSQVDVGWIIRVALKLSSSSLQYTSSVYAKNGVAEYVNSFSPTTIVPYFSVTRTIPTILSWSGAKYFSDYYENQIKYLEAVASQTTSRLKFRFSTPRAVGNSDAIRIVLIDTTQTNPFNNQNTNNPMICTFMPVIAANYEEFSVGSYGECHKDTTTSPYQYYINAPYGGLNGEYLLQIQ
jgi:hypothetical protein